MLAENQGITFQHYRKFLENPSGKEFRTAITFLRFLKTVALPMLLRRRVACSSFTALAFALAVHRVLLCGAGPEIVHTIVAGDGVKLALATLHSSSIGGV